MNQKDLKYCSYKNVSALARIAIACFFVLIIIGTEFVKMDELAEHFSIENVDFPDKEKNEKEGKKDSKIEKAEVDDFVHLFGLSNNLSDLYISHDFHYRKLPPGFYLDVLQQPPKTQT